jgi:hypothetical protein
VSFSSITPIRPTGVEMTASYPLACVEFSLRRMLSLSTDGTGDATVSLFSRARFAGTQKLFAGGSAPAPLFCRIAFGDVKSYLWVADPRQVPFLCSCKEKEPKESTPRSRRLLLALLAKIGARLTCRAQNTRLGLKHEARFSRFWLRCSAAATGTRKKPVAPFTDMNIGKVLLKPRMARPSTARLWASARRGAGECAIRAAFSLVAFFWPNKRKPPRVQGRSHPQLGFEIARKARDTL